MAEDGRERSARLGRRKKKENRLDREREKGPEMQGNEDTEGWERER